MKRQQAFLTIAINDIGDCLHKDTAIISRLFDGLDPYVVTSMSRGKTLNMANKASPYQVQPMLTLAGEHTVGADGFIEFHPDEDALIQLVLDIFYQRQP